MIFMLFGCSSTASMSNGFKLTELTTNARMKNHSPQNRRKQQQQNIYATNSKKFLQKINSYTRQH